MSSAVSKEQKYYPIKTSGVLGKRRPPPKKHERGNERTEREGRETIRKLYYTNLKEE
jgi:hypothetical protein